MNKVTFKMILVALICAIFVNSATRLMSFWERFAAHLDVQR